MEFERILDPLAEVDRFRREAEEKGLVLPEAMTLATVDEEGNPKARVVLLKGRRGRCFEFHTNYRSDKARELAAHPRAALCIHYPSLALQARVEGKVTKMSEQGSDAYFATRPRESQIGAWASRQSEVLQSRQVLDDAVREQEQRFSGVEVPRPPHWGGMSLEADFVELWVGLSGRLHDRARYLFQDGVWVCERLYP